MKDDYLNQIRNEIITTESKVMVREYINNKEIRIRKFITSDENICECFD